jgi:DnaK suppressor protein
MIPGEADMTTLLTPGQRALLQAALQLRQHQLDQQRAEHLHGDSRADHAAALLNQDGDDAPQRDADREVDLARADAQLRELGQVSRALQRIDAPDFGFCHDCGEAIAFDRLRLEPWALRCVPCESRHEGAAPHPHTL